MGLTVLRCRIRQPMTEWVKRVEGRIPVPCLERLALRQLRAAGPQVIIVKRFLARKGGITL